MGGDNIAVPTFSGVGYVWDGLYRSGCGPCFEWGDNCICVPPLLRIPIILLPGDSICISWLSSSLM